MTKKLLEKKVMIYPGKDNEYNLKAIPLRNTIVAGGVGSGVPAIFKQIMVNLVTDNSPNYIQIDYWDSFASEAELWMPKRKGIVDTDRWVPHFVRIGSSERLALEEYLVAVRDEIDRRKDLLGDVSFEEYNKRNSNKLPNYICVLNNLNRVGVESLNELLEISEQYGVYFIIVSSYTSDNLKTLIDLCSNRICSRCYPELSEMMLSSDMASVDMPKSGLCYFWNTESNKEPVKICVPFILDLFIMKLIGSLAVRKENLRD